MSNTSRSKIVRCGTESNEVFYTTPRSGSRFNYFEGKKLKIDPTIELTGRLVDRSLSRDHNSQSTHEIQKFRKVTLIRPSDSNIFAALEEPQINQSYKRHLRCVSNSKSRDAQDKSLSKVRISCITEAEPETLRRERSSNTFRSNVLAKSPSIESTLVKSELKRCEFTKYSHSTQIANLPGAKKREDQEIKDDYTFLNKSCNKLKKEFSSTALDSEKISLKNLTSSNFAPKYKHYLEKNISRMPESLQLSCESYKKQVESYGKEEETHKKHNNSNTLFQSQIIQKLTDKLKEPAKLNKVENKEKKPLKQLTSLTGICRVNNMHNKKVQTPQSLRDNIYYPFQQHGHKKVNHFMTARTFYSSSSLA